MSQTSQEIIDLNNQYLCQTYARYPVAFVRGEGCKLWDAEGKEYLDLFASLAVMNLGQCHPAVVKAVQEQVATLTHISNFATTPFRRRVWLSCCARTHLVTKSFSATAGLRPTRPPSNSPRKYGVDKRDGRYEIITVLGSFHGRTMATIAATGQEKVRQGFGPVLEGFRYVAYDDLAAMEAAVSEKTIAILVETDSRRRWGCDTTARLFEGRA